MPGITVVRKFNRGGKLPYAYGPPDDIVQRLLDKYPDLHDVAISRVMGLPDFFLDPPDKNRHRKLNASEEKIWAVHFYIKNGLRVLNVKMSSQEKRIWKRHHTE